MLGPPSTFQNGTTPTVLLVHGAFSDASAWSGVIAGLQRAGLDVAAPANPLRGLGGDAAYVASVASAIDAPVVLAGHGYGGAAVTVAGALAKNVVGVVYVAGYAVDVGESCLDVAGRFPHSAVGPALRPATYPRASRSGVELYLKREDFGPVFAGGMSAEDSAVAAAAQRPIAAEALEEPAAAAAWRRLPTWYVVACDDRVVHPDAQRYMAHRAGARTVELGSCHAVAQTHAGEVAAVLADVAHSPALVGGRRPALS